MDPVLPRRLHCLLVPRVSVTRHTYAWIVGENPLQTDAHLGRSVGDDYLAGVKRVADSNPAAMME